MNSNRLPQCAMARDDEDRILYLKSGIVSSIPSGTEFHKDSVGRLASMYPFKSLCCKSVPFDFAKTHLVLEFFVELARIRMHRAQNIELSSQTRDRR